MVEVVAEVAMVRSGCRTQLSSAWLSWPGAFVSDTWPFLSGLPHTEDEGIHCSLVVGPLVAQSGLELDINRLEVHAWYGYFAIFVKRSGRSGQSLGGEGGRDGYGQVGWVHVCG